MSFYGVVALLRHNRRSQAASPLPDAGHAADELLAASRAPDQPAVGVADDDHALTDYPCRMPDGRMGRVAVVQQGGDWALVCRIA